MGPLCRRGLRGGGRFRGGHFLRQSLSVQGIGSLGACMMSLDRHTCDAAGGQPRSRHCAVWCAGTSLGLAECFLYLQSAVLGLSEAEFPQLLTRVVLMDTHFA